MPWDAKSFAKHNHGLHGAAATKASSIANAILRSGGDEGVAIATANKYAKNHADGGVADPLTWRTSPGLQRRLSGRQPLIEDNGGQPMFGPNASQAPQPNDVVWYAQRGLDAPAQVNQFQTSWQGPWYPSPDGEERADGGNIARALHIAKRDAGGFTPPITPGYERAEERELASAKPYGFTAGVGPGRLDKNDVSVGAGSYVLPADVVAGLGDGNSLAGAAVWNKILGSMPYGITPPKSAGHRGPPAPPHNPEMMAGITGEHKSGLAEGGDVGEVPIRSADGEIIVSPEDVMRLGRHYAPEREHNNPKAMMRRAHKVLDGFVKHVRGKTIRHLRGLRGPVGSKDANKGHT